MNSQDLRAVLADRAHAIDSTRPHRVEEVHHKVVAERRRRVGAVAIAGLVCAGLATTMLTARENAATPPVDRPQNVPTIGPDRPEQVVTPNIEPGDIEREQLVGAQTNTDPDYAGDAEVAVALDVRTEGYTWDTFCSGAPGTWYVLTVSPAAVFSDVGRCDDAPVGEFPPPPSGETVAMDFSNARSSAPEERVVRMFLTNQDPREYRRCFNYSPPDGCDDVEPPHATATDASFGVAVYENAPPVVMTMLGYDIFALADVDGTEFLLSQGVTAASQSSVLTFPLAPSPHERILQALVGVEGTVELRVDGQAGRNQRYGLLNSRTPSARIAPGRAHDITIELVEGDPDHVDLGFVVFEARD